MSHNPSSESVVSLLSDGKMATPPSSTVTLIPKGQAQNPLIQANANDVPTAPKPKDFEQAYGVLSSSFGFSGTAPVKNPKKKSQPKKTATSTSSSSSSLTSILNKFTAKKSPPASTK
ncbi:hypothetical protein A0H81_08488 [Grifola frondosa]|uniref:Uncharacterized protein n=1 Tax=Grifola frondosa TaxID=5627 RepID=A0A1C7M495_GRIFR|nr:hypothetical protein A0H81_08488 [Grifola frondosa]